MEAELPQRMDVLGARVAHIAITFTTVECRKRV